MSASLGAFVSMYLGYEDLAKYYTNKNKLWLLSALVTWALTLLNMNVHEFYSSICNLFTGFILVFQAAAHFVGLGVAIFALMAYLKVR